MRFAVHRPGCPVASPRSHGVPRRDIPGRIYVRVLGEPRVLPAGCRELSALLQVGRRARSAGAPVGVLLDGEVPYIPGVAAVTFQHVLLGRRGKQPVPRHANTLANAADIYGEVKRRFDPGLKAGVSAPQSR